MMISASSSNKIANLSFLCVVLVVLGHVKWQAVGGDWAAFGRVVHSASRAILPFFFCVSGYFLARHAGEDGWWRKAVIRRIGSLGVPFFAWTLIYLLEMAAVDVALNLLDGREATEGLRGAWGSVRQFFGLDPFVYPALAPLWYVRNLFLLVLASPVLMRFIDRFRFVGLLTLSVLHLAVLCVFCCGFLSLERGIGAVLACCFSSEGVIYFAAGVYLARRDAPVPCGSCESKSAVSLAWIVSLSLLLLPLGLPALARWSYLAEGLSMPILAYAAWCTVSGREWPRWIVATAFPLYLMHPVLFDVVYGVARAFGGDVRNAPFCWMLFGVTVVGSVVLTDMLRRYCRLASNVLFGGR